jgi:hypothetical protein
MPEQCCKDFYAKIPDDEPVFTLAGRDMLAVETVAYWIERAKARGVNADKILRAQWHRAAMQLFTQDHPERMKLPD